MNEFHFSKSQIPKRTGRCCFDKFARSSQTPDETKVKRAGDKSRKFDQR